MTTAFDRLRPLFAPASVAIIGASKTPGKYGNTVLRYLLDAGFQGRIFPINPEGGVHEGVQFYRSLKDVPERIDCAFTVIPAAAIPGMTREAAGLGVRAMILAASGFTEMGSEAGAKRQDEVAGIAREAGMILLGPNTNGIWNAHHKLSLGYNTSHGEPMRAGPISVAAHSGALFDSFIPRLASFGGGFGKLVPLGNEATLDMLEMLEALIEDPETGVIGLIMEAIRDGNRFRTLSQRAHAAGKPIFVLKLGRSAAGANAAIAHSSRLAGSTRAYDALMRDCGVPVVRSIETLAAVCTLACDERALEMTGDIGLIGVSGSGGGCSLMADHAAERGIALAGDGTGKWTGETARAIAALPGIGLVRNPIDGGNLHGWDKLPGLLAAMDEDGLNGPLAGFAHRLPTIAADISLFTPLAARKARTGAPAVMVSPGAMREEVQVRYAQAGIPVFSDLAACFDSLRAIYDAVAYRAERATASPDAAPRLPADKAALIAKTLADTRTDFLSEIESAELLRLAGVPMVESSVAASIAEAQQAAAAFGYPVVAKAIAPGIAHKYDAGLVAVGIANPDALADTFTRLCAIAAGQGAAHQGAAGDAVRIIVQPRVPSRAELILGSTFEPGLGHFLIFGLGGVHAELVDSVELIAVPASPETLRRRVSGSRLGPLLARLGKLAQTDLAHGVAVALEGLQALILAAPDAIQSIDVNPLLIGEQGCIAVDALIVPRRAA